MLSLLLCESVCMCTCVFAHDICECRPESRGKTVWSVLSFTLPVLGFELGRLACFMHFIRPSIVFLFQVWNSGKTPYRQIGCFVVIYWPSQIVRPLTLFRTHKSGPEHMDICWSWWADNTKCLFFSSSLMIWTQPRRKYSEAFFRDNWNFS